MRNIESRITALEQRAGLQFKPAFIEVHLVSPLPEGMPPVVGVDVHGQFVAREPGESEESLIARAEEVGRKARRAVTILMLKYADRDG